MKSQQWILHVEGKSLRRGYFGWEDPPVELLLGGHLNSYEEDKED
jgi:hypothetical protein